MVKWIPALGVHNLFSFTGDNGEILPVTYNDLTLGLRQLLLDIGVQNVQQYSSHSLHRGGTMHAFNRRIPERMIQMLGNWSSLAYRRYIDVTLESRLKAWYLMSA